jgi:hypothetical protein
MAMTGSTYVLEGRETELAQHAGHQVEVTGTLAPAGSSSSTTGTTGSTGATGSTSSGTTSASGGSTGSSSSMSSAANQRIEVTSVRMISSTCTQ